MSNKDLLKTLILHANLPSREPDSAYTGKLSELIIDLERRKIELDESKKSEIFRAAVASLEVASKLHTVYPLENPDDTEIELRRASIQVSYCISLIANRLIRRSLNTSGTEKQFWQSIAFVFSEMLSLRLSGDIEDIRFDVLEIVSELASTLESDDLGKFFQLAKG